MPMASQIAGLSQTDMLVGNCEVGDQVRKCILNGNPAHGFRMLPERGLRTIWKSMPGRCVVWRLTLPQGPVGYRVVAVRGREKGIRSLRGTTSVHRYVYSDCSGAARKVA
jgi:hypothetical protein